jgi:FixJ family two-component response regulator
MNSEALVWIVDDDVAFARSLGEILASRGLNYRTFASADEFLRRFDPWQAGCVMLDVRLHGTTGLAVQESLNRLPLIPSIIVMTGFGEVATAVRAMRQGALDFLQKTCSETELYEAVQRALERNADNRRAYARQKKFRERAQSLTSVEHEVLQLILAGNANKNIAAKLGVSERTVEDRRARIMQKFEVSSIPEMVLVAVVAGLHGEA